MMVAVGVVAVESPLHPVKTCWTMKPTGEVTENVAVDPSSYQPAPVGVP